MKTKKSFVKCSRKHCNNTIRVKRNGSWDSLRFCSQSCQGADRMYKIYDAEKTEGDKTKSKVKMIDGAFEVFSSLMELIRKDVVIDKLLVKINKEIGGVKFAQKTTNNTLARN